MANLSVACIAVNGNTTAAATYTLNSNEIAYITSAADGTSAIIYTYPKLSEQITYTLNTSVDMDTVLAANAFLVECVSATAMNGVTLATGTRIFLSKDTLVRAGYQPESSSRTFAVSNTNGYITNVYFTRTLAQFITALNAATYGPTWVNLAPVYFGTTPNTAATHVTINANRVVNSAPDTINTGNTLLVYKDEHGQVTTLSY